MTPIQRRACLALYPVSYGRLIGPRAFALAMHRRADGEGWRSIQLTDRQLERLANHVRKFRRQIGDPNLLFWAQRVLAEAKFSKKEEGCPSPQPTASALCS